MNKKALVILGAIFLLIIGTLGFLVYSRRSSNTDTNSPVSDQTPVSDNSGSGGENSAETDVNNSNITTTTPEQTEKFFLLTSSEQIISPILFYNGNGITYLNQIGQLIKSDFDFSPSGQITLTRTRNLGIEAKSGISKILWPKNGDDFIAEVIRAGNKSFSYFNFAAGAYVELPSQVKAVEWLPAGDKILYIWADKTESGVEKATLNIAKPDTSEYKEIAELWESDDAIYLSPDGLNIAMHRTTNTESVNKLFMTDITGKIWKDLAKDGVNFGILWSPDSQKFLFSKRERTGRNYQLWVYDLYSGEIKNLGLYGAPAKAAWASNSRTIYFAAPKDSSEIIDPSLLEGPNSVLTKDAFYKVDAQTSEKTEYVPENLSLDGRDLFLNPSEDKLFFKNAQDGGLYYLDLTQ